MKVEFIDNSDQVLAALHESVERALIKCGMTAERYSKELCDGFKHPTGNLRNSITHRVTENEMILGTAVEYGPYVELGTGHHYPGGRQDAWVYQDEKGNWHRTKGQKPKPYIKPALADHKETYRNIILSELNDE